MEELVDYITGLQDEAYNIQTGAYVLQPDEFATVAMLARHYRAALAQAQAERDAALASLAAKPTLSEWAELTQARSFAESALAQAQQDRASQQAEIKDLYERLAGENAEVINCLKNIAELVAERRGLQLELSDAREELRLIKQTTRPVPGDLLDEKNQHGEYSMDTPPFDYALYGIAGEPQHDTSGKPCWCGAKADGEGVVVHRDIAEVLTSARQLGQFDAQPDYAAARSAVESELRAIAHIYGTADGLEQIDSVSGMLSQISNIIAGVASQRDAATRRAEQAEALAAQSQMASMDAEIQNNHFMGAIVGDVKKYTALAEEIKRYCSLAVDDLTDMVGDGEWQSSAMACNSKILAALTGANKLAAALAGQEGGRR